MRDPDIDVDKLAQHFSALDPGDHSFKDISYVSDHVLKCSVPNCNKLDGYQMH